MFLQISQNSQGNTCATQFSFIKKEIPAQMFSFEFCEISRNTFLKNPSDGCFCINTRSVYCPTTTFCFFHTYFKAEYFLGLNYRLGTRVSSIFQTLLQTPTLSPVQHLRRSFQKIVNSLKQLSIFYKKAPL